MTKKINPVTETFFLLQLNSVSDDKEIHISKVIFFNSTFW